MRNRGSVILIHKGKVALIKRVREDSIYYVFPGGGIEKGETPEEGAKREAFEELGVEVEIKECFSKVEFNGTQYFFFANIINGVFGSGKGEEFSELNRERGNYFPMWMDIELLSTINVLPTEVALKVHSLFITHENTPEI